MSVVKYRRTSRALLEGVEGLGVLLPTLATWPVSKRWLRDWGSTSRERTRQWPGDSLVRSTPEVTTRAIDIDASADEVWPWLVQFGLGRAGFYSYELFERLVGIPVKNVESVEEALQHLSPGDEILLYPRAPGIPVASVEDGKQLCFGVDPQDATDADHPGRSWSFYIEQVTEQRCRLILRGCIEEPRVPTLKQRVEAALVAPIDFVMEQRTLRTIKRLAEVQR